VGGLSRRLSSDFPKGLSRGYVSVATSCMSLMAPLVWNVVGFARKNKD